MILIGREEEIQNIFSNSEHVKNFAKKITQGTGHSLDLEAKRSGMENQITLLMENGKTQPTWWWNNSRNLDIQCSKVFLHWLVESWKRRTTGETIHFNAETSNTELLYRTIHSATQLSIYGAVAGWCEDFGVKSHEKPPTTMNDDLLTEVQPKEVTSLVKVPRNAQSAAGNSLREVQQNFETLGTQVWRSGIHPWSCCRKVLQNSLRCWWWYRRSNSCEQRVYKCSCRLWFWNLCCD